YGGVLLDGLAITLILSVCSWILSFAVGLFLTLVRMTKVKVIEWCVLAFVEYQRNVPPLVRIFLWYFGVSSILPESLQEVVNEYHGEFVFAAI
ncbi:ABC transporter permease subunit, partial [Pseudomonas viridiflava]|uniref:ABC transporter permease subunit n=1 Tax=Pseudomonas viridiflava TaxID=33069 RepID=UPI0013DEF015